MIQTEWGTISPGIIVAAITASLEAQRVLVTDILNADVFKAGLAEPIVESPGEWEEYIETLNTVKETPRVANADISNVWVATLAGMYGQYYTCILTPFFGPHVLPHCMICFNAKQISHMFS